jgi:hypothetical protein
METVLVGEEHIETRLSFIPGKVLSHGTFSLRECLAASGLFLLKIPAP